MNPDDIDRLVDAARNRDHAAFHTLIVSVLGDLRLVLCGFALSPETTEELTQDTLITVWQKLDGYRSEGTFQPWLHAIARNKARELLRRQRRSVSLSQATIEDLISETEAECLADEEAGLEQARRLADCLALLPERSRDLLTLRYIDERPLTELAERFRIGENALAALFYRLRTKLRLCVEGLS